MRIVIPQDPIAKARHRSFIRAGKIATYDKQHQEAAVVITLMGIQMRDNSFEIAKGPIKVDFQFNFLPPNSTSDALKSIMLWNHTAHVTKPDTSNLIKFYEDCGNSILWDDDRQIVDITAKKNYSKTPCTIITVTEINENMSKKHEDFLKVFSPDDLHNLLDDLSHFWISTPNANRPTRVDFHKDEVVAFADKIMAFATKWCDKLKKVRPK